MTQMFWRFHLLSPSSVSGTTIVYFLYYYSYSIHFRDHLAIILNVTVGSLSLFYLFLLDLACINFACLFCASLSIFYTSLYLFCLACIFFTQNISQKRHNPCFFLHSPVRTLFNFLRVPSDTIRHKFFCFSPFSCGRHDYISFFL